MYQLEKSFHFHAAHRNTQLVGDKCFYLHGHTYAVILIMDNSPKEGNSTGLLFSEVERIGERLVKQYCHTVLAKEGDEVIERLGDLAKFSIFPFETSAENLAKHFFDLFYDEGVKPIRVGLKETTSTTIWYEP